MKNNLKFNLFFSDQEITKEKLINDKKLQEEIKTKREEISHKLSNKLIEISNCDFDGNSTSIFLTNEGYVYKESDCFADNKITIKIIGYIDPKGKKKFLKYLLEEEKVLERKDNNHIIYDYNVSISFHYNNKSFIIPDDEVCANNNISKYSKGCLTSRIEDKLYRLAKTPTDLSDFTKRKKLNEEFKQINILVEIFNEKKDEIPSFLRKI